MDQQLLAQGLSSGSLYQFTAEVALYIVDVLSQWTSLKCGLPHQFCLGPLGGPEAGRHLDTHGHVTITPLLTVHGEAGGGECMQRTSIYIGVAADRKQSQVLALPWLGRVCWLGRCHYQDYRVFLGIFQERQAITQVCACLAGGNEDEGCPQTLWQVDPCTGLAAYNRRRPTHAKHVADWTTRPTLRGG